MRRMCIGVFLLFAALATTVWSEKVGEVLYLEGEQEVVRNQRVMDEEEIYIGMKVENFDLIRTKPDGLVEFQIDVLNRGGSIVTVHPDTVFHVEIAGMGRLRKPAINMIAGTITMRVQKLTGTEPLSVRTETLVMGVRGTVFSVCAPPGGEVLVTCSEGEVRCTDSGGRSLSALPGVAVEHVPGEQIRDIPVAVSDIEAFQEDWYTDRIAALKVNALRAIASFAQRYDELHVRFLSAYGSLLEQKDVTDKWIAEDTRGTVGSVAAVMREKKTLIGPLLEIRGVLFLLEKVYFRLLELERYHEDGHGVGDIQAGVSTTDFFTRFDAEHDDLAHAMHTVRYVTKLYAARNEGRFPADWSSPKSGAEDFFGDEFEWDEDE